MARLDFSGKWVLITGASAGLGHEMAIQFASRHKANLVLMARRADRLEELRQSILAVNGHINILCVPCDLSDLNAMEQKLADVLSQVPLYAAVLNAGMTYFGRHIDMAIEVQDRLLDLNIRSVLQMTTLLVRHFEESKKEGGVMIVSSMAAQFPTPYQAVYSGTKAFLLNFALALGQELHNKRFSLTVYLPSGIATEMTAGEKFGTLRKYLMPVQQASREAISAFGRRRPLWIPGAWNRIGLRLSWFIPKRFVLSQMAKTYLRSLLESEKVV